MMSENEIILERAVILGLLSAEQVSIVLERLHDPKGVTYTKLRKKYLINSDKTLVRLFIRTAAGRKWTRNLLGGNEPYLSDIDQ
jgi:hypothetical protein